MPRFIQFLPTWVRLVKQPKLARGYTRFYALCRECGRVYFYDLIAGSLSNPVMSMPCGHQFRSTTVSNGKNVVHVFGAISLDATVGRILLAKQILTDKKLGKAL